MNKSEIISIAEKILDESKAAVLSSVNQQGFPVVRWMSPVFLREYRDYIYAVTSPKFGKSADLAANPKVQWMFQNLSLDTIINFTGRLSLVENTALRSEVIEKLGSRLRTFWTINKDPSSLVVLETEIVSGMIFFPVKGRRELVSFSSEVTDGKA